MNQGRFIFMNYIRSFWFMHDSSDFRIHNQDTKFRSNEKKNSNLFLKLVICFNWHFNCSNLLDQIGTSKNMLKNYFVKVQVFEKATKIWSNLPRSFDRNRKIELYKNWSDISLLVNYQNNFPNKIPWFCCH